MTEITRDPWRRSRITKAIVDAALAPDWVGAEAMLHNVRLRITIGEEVATTAAGQAALLTAVATSFRCFELVEVICPIDVRLRRALPLGKTLGEAVRALGGTLVDSKDTAPTHVVLIGADDSAGFAVRCWWNGWLAGVLPVQDTRKVSASWNPLAGIAAGALAVREVFASAIGNARAGRRTSITSLWEPWEEPSAASKGPQTLAFPDALWMIGLGHLGQGTAWALSFIPARGRPVVTLQDDQVIEAENEATCLLVRPGQLGLRKTRVVADWLEAVGWETRIIERRYDERMRPSLSEPGLCLCGLDDLLPRQIVARSGFDYVIDAGVGHGPQDFQRLQIKIVRAGKSDGLWSPAPNSDRNVETLLARPAYQNYSRQPGVCGALPLARASVAVPFVGAFAGAMMMAAAARIANLQGIPRSIQVELPAPDLITVSDFIEILVPISASAVDLG